MKKNLALASLTVGLCLAADLARAEILDHWYWRNPAPFANSLKSVSFGDGKYVAAGEAGIIHTSTDGVTWDAGRRATTKKLNRVAYINNGFVAVGDGGTILTSSNGLVWTPQVSGVTTNLLGAAFGNGKYIVTGAGGQLVISTNGV